MRTAVASAAEEAKARPQGCTNLKVRQLARVIGRYYEAHAVPGLKNTQYSLLSHIVKLGPVRPGELAQAMRLDASTLTRNLQPLVAQGWAVVNPGADGRSRLVEATEAGKAVREQGQRAWKKAQLEINGLLGAERVLALHGLIDECIAVLEAAGHATEEGAEHE